ncbi:hypothetical protein F383_32731 [Gossypium arboreum]|uniref:Uncharacterized protein n=1 Tax=Gossypium arboreum TaxID=29729 RepID=A0A0B0MZP5_GOSAR|nr:hypothetical protein F383_32731 [Gossypium arboreum]
MFTMLFNINELLYICINAMTN